MKLPVPGTARSKA